MLNLQYFQQSFLQTLLQRRFYSVIPAIKGIALKNQLYNQNYYCKSNLLAVHDYHCLNFFPFASMSFQPFCAEYDKTGRAKCKKCKQKIDKGVLRLGKVTTNPFSESGGTMKMWHHPDCLFETFKKARTTTKKLDDPYDDLEGWEGLAAEDKRKIQDMIDDLQNYVKTPAKKSPVKKTPQKQTPQMENITKKPPQKELAITSKSLLTSNKADISASSSKAFTTERNDPGMDGSLRDNSFREFRRVCANIGNNPSYLEKTNIVSNYLKYGSNKTKFEGDLRLWVKLLLPGVIKRVYNLQSKQLVKLFSQLYNTNQEEMLEHLEQGDVAETIATFFEKSTVLVPIKKCNLSIQDVDVMLEELAGMTKEEEQSYMLKKITKKCTANDLKMVIRIIKGDLRINAGAKHILEGVHPDAYEAFQTTRNIDIVIDQILIVGNTSGSLNIGAQVMTPVLPMLAEACKSVEYAFKKCPSGAMYAEIKYDGERVQVHKKGNNFMYFSRSLKPVMAHKVNHFKEYIPDAFPYGEDLILDAEVLMINNKTAVPLPFGTLGVHKKAETSDANVCLFVFDCIHYNGENLMNKTIAKRRQILEEKMVEVKNHVMFSEMKLIKRKEDLQNMINRVLKQGLEGLVLKDTGSVYEPGKRHWLKVKKDYLHDGAMADSADLVVLGAWFGTGKKGGMMSVFLMGCFDSRINKWCTVTKVHTGHDDATLAGLQKELDMVKISQDVDRVPTWLKCNKPMVPDFVCANPKKSPVWEITGAEFTRHQIHTADGISIRFPRVTKIRDDKGWEEATSLAYLQELYKKSREFQGITVDDDGGMEDEIMNMDNDDGGDDRNKTSISSPSKLLECHPKKLSPREKVQAKLSQFAFIKEPESPLRENIIIKNDESKSSKQEKTSKKRLYDDSFSENKKSCKYNKSCHNKNPAHLMMYEHSVLPDKHPTKNPLPNFLNGVQIYMLKDVEKQDILRRYIIAYGGELLPEFRSHEATHIIVNKKSSDFVPSGTIRVSSDWLWDVIKLKKMHPSRLYAY